jgi:hypothetical protein
MNSKDAIDQAVQRVIEYRIADGRMRVEDNEKLLALRARIIEDVKKLNHPIWRWFINLFRR